MKQLVMYSSQTGNTKLIAEIIHAELPADKDIVAEGVQFDPDAYDVLYIGYHIEKGTCSDAVKQLLSQLHHKKVALFGTMGSPSNGEYGQQLSHDIAAMLPEDNTLLGEFICQGKIAPSFKARYMVQLQQDPNNEQIMKQLDTYEQSQSHPDENDQKQAKAFAQLCISQYLN